MFEGWEAGPPRWIGPGPVDAQSLRRRFSVELEANGPGKDSGRPSRENFRRAIEPTVRQLDPPVGDHPLRAHPVRKIQGWHWR